MVLKERKNSFQKLWMHGKMKENSELCMRNGPLLAAFNLQIKEFKEYGKIKIKDMNLRIFYR